MGEPVVNRLPASLALTAPQGSGGSAVAWDRWSERTGEQVHLTAFLDPAAPTAGEVTMVVTHLPLLIVGLVLLAVSFRRANA